MPHSQENASNESRPARPVLVLLAPETEDHWHHTLATLERAGLLGGKLQEALGTVTGSVTPDQEDALKRVPGVLAVEWARKLETVRPRDRH